jgi:3',5'-cyclic AMP phosphodiesterase CpdA
MGDETIVPDYPALLEHEPLEYIRNEGPFISRAAILDAVGRGATHIVLNGDYGDATERAVYDAFAADLKDYEDQYGVDFLFVRGNHDSITNENHETGEEHDSPLFDGTDLDNSRTYSIGALELFEKFKAFGLSNDENDAPPIDYLYWEFGPATENGCGTADAGEECVTQTQFSYLVEPVENLWFLIIDTNGFSENGGGSGWTSDGLKISKPRTWAWIEDVYERAAEQHKTVIAFGHHNLGDPFCGLTFNTLSFLEGALFDTKQSAKELADLGMKIYVSGHLHMDYISDFARSDFSLIDVQTPSLANYPVGYRLFTFYEDETLTVETVAVRDVSGWDTYLSDYQAFAAVNDYHFEQFDVQDSPSFDEFVNRTFENMITVKIEGAVGDGVVPLLKLIKLYDLLLLGGLGENVERTWIVDGQMRFAADPDSEKTARDDLNARIEDAGL